MTDKNTTIAASLFELRADFKDVYPSPQTVATFIEGSMRILFPHFDHMRIKTAVELQALIDETREQLGELCVPMLGKSAALDDLLKEFVSHLPHFHQVLREDAQAIYRGDPAAYSVDEVILSYPGFYAIAVYRIAHWLLSRKITLLPRLMTEFAHARTGIDIHPGATIGGSFVIDHGTGIVIGETTHIHDNVKVYQGVTLGALSVDKTLNRVKRHPTIESNVVIYANATILGGDTVIGAGSVIGGNVWLTSSVSAGSRVYHRSDITVKSTEHSNNSQED